MQRMRMSGDWSARGAMAAALWAGSGAAGQCTTEVTTRMGGEMGHVASIDANRVLVSNGTALEIHNVTNPAAIVRTGRLEIGEQVRVGDGILIMGPVHPG